MKNRQQWGRVTGVDLKPSKVKRQQANEATLRSKTFTDACEEVGIEPTTRQASKWNLKRGLAYKTNKCIV